MLLGFERFDYVERLGRLHVEVSCHRQACERQPNSEDVLHLLVLPFLVGLANFLEVVVQEGELILSELNLARDLIL